MFVAHRLGKNERGGDIEAAGKMKSGSLERSGLTCGRQGPRCDRAAATAGVGTRGLWRTFAILGAVLFIWGGAVQVASAQTPLQYYGGEISRSPNLFLIFWGSNWNSNSGARSEVEATFSALSQSDYQGILTQYYDGTGHISAGIGVNAWTDGSITAPGEVNWAHIEQEIQYAVAQRGWPGGGINNIYLVLPAPGSGYASGFVRGCGAHYFSTAVGSPEAYIGWSGQEPFLGCREADPTGQKRAWVSVLATATHEYAEAVTDPLTPAYVGHNTGWLDSEGEEIADKCSGLNAAPWNGHYVSYLWDNSQGQCSISHPITPPPPPPSPPTVETKPATGIQEGQATLNGTVNPNGTQTAYHFEYGKTVNYGSSIPVPDGDAGPGTGPVTVYLTPNTLLPRTRYHFRLVASNAGGTSYGADQAFTTGVKWSVRNSNSAGNAQVGFWFGLPGETRVSGDWNGDGIDTPGAYNPATGVWKLGSANTTGASFNTFQYGGGPWTKPVVGDWDGNGTDTIGVYDPSAGNWNLRNTNSSGPPDKSFQYGGGAWETPVAGDWNAIAGDTIGVYDKETGNWNLKNCLCAGSPDYSFQYGGGPWSGAVAGDWNGDGIDSIGVIDPAAGNWSLHNTNAGGNPDYSFQYGGPQYQFTVGDWDGNGTETPAVSEANAPTAIEYQLRNANSGGNPELVFESGSPEQEPLAGDWNGDKVTTTGRYERSTGIWRLRGTNQPGIFSATEFQYGGAQFKPVVGDWNGDGTETVGLYEPIEGRWELRNENSAGNPTLNFQYGGAQFKPVVGDWNGDGKDTIGLYEPVSGQWSLRNSNSAGNPDLSFQYGGGAWETPVAGNWNAIAGDTIGVYDNETGNWNLKNCLCAGNPDYSFQYGGAQFKPVVGDWDGNKTDTVGLVTW